MKPKIYKYLLIGWLQASYFIIKEFILNEFINASIPAYVIAYCKHGQCTVYILMPVLGMFLLCHVFAKS